ncbi:hypothetical protein GOBAR_AA05201 [Gossypium barbadense]|uniref:Major facilitator superfamily (MFS) profile domain-containing protein n=2 Tax=Gossypium barbadense TaxID=3634 RepID=A0A2P5YIF2_GOSBA|nr:hypothetical protein GOBAR_AA05201 [Gossypium barbadense]
MDAPVTPVAIDNDHQNPSKLLPSQKNTSKGGWNAAIFVIFVEMAERFAFYGLAGNLITYLTNNLGQPVAAAAKNVNTWVGVSAIFPLLGAFVADSYLGRFKTILASSSIYFLFDETNPEEKAAKSSFFNWWYLGIVTGCPVAIVVVIYLQDNVSWAAGFGVLAGSLAVALALFLIGMKKYRKQRPTGSPFTRVAQVFVAAARKWRLTESHGSRGICCEDDRVRGQTMGPKLVRTNQFRFLDKAMMIDNDDAMRKSRNPWKLCSLNQVEEVKLLLRLIPIWVSCLMFCAVITQLHTFFTKQGSTMSRSLGPNFQVPPAALQSLVGLTILIAVPVYDCVFVPIARKLTKNPTGITMLQRIGIGLFVSILNMVVAGIVETARVNTTRKHGLIDTPKAVIPMSIWWLLPQYVLTGIGDVFTIIGLQELFYDQMPEEMRSIGAAAYISIVGIGSFVNTGIISVVQMISSKHGKEWLGDNLNRSNLNYFYWVLAGLSAINLCVYMWISSAFEYKKVEGYDEISEGKELEMEGYSDVRV